MTDRAAGRRPDHVGAAEASDAAVVHLPTSTATPPEMAVATERRTRKKRSRLSCMECRQRKLACDRNHPCQRCTKAGRASQCTFERGAGPAPGSLGASVVRQQEDIQRLQDEIASLKSLLSGGGGGGGGVARSAQLQGGVTPASVHDTGAAQGDDEGRRHLYGPAEVTMSGDAGAQHGVASGFPHNVAQVPRPGPAHPSTRAPRGYYSRHTLFRFFTEIPDLFPLITETAAEWFQPLGVHIERAKPTTYPETITPALSDQGFDLFSLLPPRADTDELVFFYLAHLEHLHRVVHVPTFQRDYAKFWAEGRPRHPAMAALVLAMLSVSTSVSSGRPGAAPVAARYVRMPALWIAACDGWAQQPSPKHRTLVHYEVRCLVYMAKRVNNMGKKSFWKDTGALVHDAVLDGLHCDPRSATTADSPFAAEMKRRLWCVLRELHLQTSFECGLPTLLHSLESDVDAPANLDDEALDDHATEQPQPKPPGAYTAASFQIQSARSWALRLEISRRLYAATSAGGRLGYAEVLQYTHKLNQALGEIPTWEGQNARSASGRDMALLARGVLQCQLKECILALHRPHLENDAGDAWLSRVISHEVSCEILLLGTRLADHGLQSLVALREDVLLAALTLARLAASPSPDRAGHAGGLPASRDAGAVAALLQQCLPLQEERYLGGCQAEPWCLLTLGAALMVVQLRAGLETRPAAKAACARRFLDLYYRRTGVQPNSPAPVGAAARSFSAGGAPLASPAPSLTGTTGTTGTTGAGLLQSEWTPADFPTLDTDIMTQKGMIHGTSCNRFGRPKVPRHKSATATRARL